MVKTHHILAEITAGISELKKNPMAVVGQGDYVRRLDRTKMGCW